MINWKGSKQEIEWRHNYGKKRFEKFKALGICPICSKNKAEIGHVCCQDCLISKRLNNLHRSKNYIPIIKEILEKQNNQCAICKLPLKKILIDHCHKMNKIRGILCSSCNVGLGLFKDNPELLKKAIHYIEINY